MILKQVIKYTNAPGAEATWVERRQLPDVQIPPVLDDEGIEIEPARIEPGGFDETIVRCHAYGPGQMDMLAADLGDDAPQFAELMAEIAATHVPPPPPTQEETLAPYVAAMDLMFDTTAQARRYDNRVTCALRAGYPGPFQAEGQAFATWMDDCYALGYQVLGQVTAGRRPQPTVEEFLAELPPMVWPG